MGHEFSWTKGIRKKEGCGRGGDAQGRRGIETGGWINRVTKPDRARLEELTGARQKRSLRLEDFTAVMQPVAPKSPTH